MSQKIEHKIKRYLIRFLTFAYIIFMISFIGFHVYYSDKVLPNVYVGDISVGGMKFDEVENLLKTELSTQNTQFKLKIKTYESDITAEDIKFEFLPVATAKKAFMIGRSNGLKENIREKILSILNPITIVPEYTHNDSDLESLIQLSKIEALDEAREPSYYLEEDEVKMLDGKRGETFDEAYVKKEILKHLIYRINTDIVAETKIVAPTLSLNDLIKVKFDVEQILKKKYVLTFRDSRWELDKTTTLKFLKPVKKSADKVAVVIDKSAVLDKLNEIGEQINRNPRGQVLEVQDGKAVNFTAQEDGLRLVVKDSYDAIEKGLFDGQGIDNEEKLIALAVEVTTPPEASNDYKIEDVLGIGTSQFKGSDAGRLHNVGHAAGKVTGILVEPGGTFSFVEAVGPIDRAHGFTSAKVISGGRTVLGDGGGVCQVSTTVFRAALNAGLPIVERNAHSYRVSYYEQDSGPGMDATIYSPSVDLKFKNDTEGYILIVSEFNKDAATLKFTIYGKSDGRTVELTQPKILSQTKPPEAKYIDDSSLPKGKKRAQEYPIWGASVSFDRVVKKADGSVLYDDTFKSNYRAWGAVYLVGTAE